MTVTTGHVFPLFSALVSSKPVLADGGPVLLGLACCLFSFFVPFLPAPVLLLSARLLSSWALLPCVVPGFVLLSLLMMMMMMMLMLMMLMMMMMIAYATMLGEQNPQYGMGWDMDPFPIVIIVFFFVVSFFVEFVR
jgi:hypothetical protein